MLTPLVLTLTTAILALLPTLTHSLSYPGPAPVIAHFPFDTDYTSQFNAYTAAPPASTTTFSPPTLATSQASVACPFGGGCASFNGASYLTVEPWLPMVGTVDGAPLTSWSVSVWVNSAQTGWQGVLGMWNGGSFVWSLRLINNSPDLIWVYRDANYNQQRVELQSSLTVTGNTWNHLVITFNATSSTVLYWINGVLTDTFQTTAVYNYLGEEPALGWKVGLIEDVMYGFVGGLDELWSFSDALSGDEVLLLRSINSIGSCAPGSAGVAQYRIGVCNRCQPGSYAAEIGSLVCQVCPAGTTASASGAVACQACAAGSYAPTTNSTQCLTCPAGYYSPTPGSSACLPCAAGTYSAAGATTCSYCPANTLSPPASTTAASCTACPTGTSGGSTVPVCCTNGVSAAGQLLAGLGVGLTGFGVQNACVLKTDVQQQPGSVVDFLSDYCGVGYDGVLTTSLQSLYGEFNSFQSLADQTALQRVYCNP